jgi:hypothetical protein
LSTIQLCRRSAIDQGAVVENKGMGEVLRIAHIVQAERDQRAFNAPSTAHRTDGHRVPRPRALGMKAQKELTPGDLAKAMRPRE